MSGSRLPPLRPLAESPAARESDLDLGGATTRPGELVAADKRPADGGGVPWERAAGVEVIDGVLKTFCRDGELVYAAVVDRLGVVGCSVCTVGARPHNEDHIGVLVGNVFATARLLGEEVGERDPQGLNLQGTRWSYSLDSIAGQYLLLGIYPSKALPAIVRACAQKSIPALREALEIEKNPVDAPD